MTHIMVDWPKAFDEFRIGFVTRHIGVFSFVMVVGLNATDVNKIQLKKKQCQVTNYSTV